MRTAPVWKREAYEARMFCGHRRFLPRALAPGNVVYCEKCQDLESIIHTQPQCHVVCESCSYRRGYGPALVSARVAMTRHVQSHPTHHAKTMVGGRVRDESFPLRNQYTLELFPEDVPPF